MEFTLSERSESNGLRVTSLRMTGSGVAVEKGVRAAEVYIQMDPNRSIKLRWLHGMLHDVSSELASLQFSRIGAHTWQPAINAYRCDKCIRVCVDLAGVERSRIDLTVESDRLVLRGVRDVPEPTHAEGRAVQLLAMEIDYGPFEREVRLPKSVDMEKVHAEQRNGLLWISLPLKS